jgi:hypothetical protein
MHHKRPELSALDRLGIGASVMSVMGLALTALRLLAPGA